LRFKADLTLLFISIIWGSAFVAQRIAGQSGSVYLFNGIRYVLAGLVVLPVAIRTRRKEYPLLYREQLKWMFVAGLLLFIASALQQVGMVFTTAGNAGFITSLYVVLVPLGLFAFWREKFHWLLIIAVSLAVLGAFLLSTSGRFEFRLGDLLEFIGAIFWALHVIVVGKFGREFEPTSCSVGQLVICGLLNLSVGIFVETASPFSSRLVIPILYTALLSLGLCYTLQIWAQRHTPPADAALILSLESVFAVLTGWLFLGEQLSIIQTFGCILIFIAVLLTQVREWTSSKITPLN
jgi:drug/metabolite transporter (DMT)-like permease